MSDVTEATALAELRSAIGSALLISVGGETKMPREDWLRIESAGLRLWGEMPVVGVIPQEDSAQSVSEAAATVRTYVEHTTSEDLRLNGCACGEDNDSQWCYFHSHVAKDALTALALLVERAERAASLEARMTYIASEYDCYCETPGTSNDCAVCEVRAALAAGSESET